MEYKLKDQLKDNIVNGKFSEAEKIANKLPLRVVLKHILDIIDEISNPLPYYFFCFLADKKKTEEYYLSASTIAGYAVPYLPGGYAQGLDYVKKAHNLKPSIANKELILSFNDVPDKPLLDKEAYKIAKEILKEDPKNEVALKKIEKLEKKKETTKNDTKK